jgi:hypothetical protein
MTTDPYLLYYRDGTDALSWYTDAHVDIMLASSSLGCRPEYLAGLLAAFSPRTSVRRSCIWAVRYARTRTFAHDVPVSVRTHVDKFVNTGRVTGPKTGPFWLALLGSPDAVVIDSHMLRAGGYDLNPSVAQFQDCIDRVIAVARHRCPPSSAQAAIWTGYLRSIGRNPGPFPLLDTLHHPDTSHS